MLSNGGERESLPIIWQTIILKVNFLFFLEFLILRLHRKMAERVIMLVMRVIIRLQTQCTHSERYKRQRHWHNDNNVHLNNIKFMVSSRCDQSQAILFWRRKLYCVSAEERNRSTQLPWTRKLNAHQTVIKVCCALHKCNVGVTLWDPPQLSLLPYQLIEILQVTMHPKKMKFGFRVYCAFTFTATYTVMISDGTL